MKATELKGLLSGKVLGAKGGQALLAIITIFIFSSCEAIKDIIPDEPIEKAEKIQPKGPAPEWAPNIDPQMLAVIEQFQSFNVVPYPMLTADQAREEPTFKDAYVELLQKITLAQSLLM